MAWKPDYISVADMSAYLRVNDTVDDVQVGSWVTAASRAIDKLCNRQFGQEAAPVARTYRRAPVYDRTLGLWTLEIDDLMTTTGLLVNGVAYASSGTTLMPDNAPADGRPWTRLAYAVQPDWSTPGYSVSAVVTARWGWTAIPPQVVAAVKLQCARWNARRDSPYGIAGSPDNGSEMRLLAKLDPDVSTSLAGLSRRRRVG